MSVSPDFFFPKIDDALDHHSLNQQRVDNIVSEALKGMDDGELYLQYGQSESLAFQDGRLTNASFDTTQGFGLRAVLGEATGFAHANDISESALRRASQTVRAVKTGNSGSMSLSPRMTNTHLYGEFNPVEGQSFKQKVKLLSEIDAFARSEDSRVKQVMASMAASWQVVDIIRTGGQRVRDIRPLIRLNISVIMENGDRRETGYDGAGGRVPYDHYFQDQIWQSQVREAIRQGSVNLESVEAPAGETTVVLGPGWPGILLHEAVGHGLEGDFIRKKTSAFSGLIGERVASAGVTVIDDGSILDRRGSLSIDDEGTPTERTVLIEDGILKGFMQDRLNARLMGVNPTGNGRRESFSHTPMPRMTNTFMLGGDKEPEDIIASVDDGIYAANFGGGQVDITSGKFVFSCTEAYKIRKGKIAEPVKGATLIGNGPDCLTRVSMIGNDLKLDNGVGTCGKAGQSVPAGVGQPTLRLDGLTVGGTG